MDEETKDAAVKLDLEIYAIIIKYMDLKSVLTRMIVLNKEVREAVMSENYTIFKKFIR